MAQDRDITRKNHYLPESYLLHFANPGGRVLRTYLGPDGKLHEGLFSPSATGFEQDLYSFQPEPLTGPSSTSDVIERQVFGPIDHHGIEAARKVLQFAPSHLSDDEKENLALYLNSFLERHPQRLRVREPRAVEMGRETMERLRRAWGPPLDGRPDVLDLIDTESMSKNMLRRHMVEQIQDKETIQYLKRFTFIKVHIDENPVIKFVTGDNPVLVNHGKPWPIHWLTFALDPENLLIGHGLSEPLEDAELLLHMCIAHNLELFRQCEFVYSRDVLEDMEIVKTRRAAALFLRKLDQWPTRGARREPPVR